MNPNHFAQFISSARFLLLLFVPFFSMCKKGVDPENSTIIGHVYTTVDQAPTFPGGQAELNNFLMRNLRYPAEAQRAKIKGKVIVGFVVTDRGRIANPEIRQSVGGGCDEEAIRIVKAMPNWLPGQLNGKPVNVQTSLPFSFTLL
ncbi:energy transducer TonB [Spirosoma radiotolerans]|uniref:energy transducer TonB n=1 Tax=Spirosoma radiotolerans TaxID=1379870 RepID=UPI000695B004|nr:energy transducer TonB [Spirosoma radiotolerans]